MITSKQKPSASFTAIDVEYADHEQNICQIGLAVVRDLEITERRSWLVHPPLNRYEQRQTDIHGIGPKDTEDAPVLEEVWPEIEPYLRGELWAHNAVSVEQPVIEKNLRMHGIDAAPVRVHDSRDLYQRRDCPANRGNGLEQCCMALGIPCENHHDACADAVMCAEIVIAAARGQQPDWTGVPESNEEMRKMMKGRLVLHPGEFQAHMEKQKAGTDVLEDGSKPDLFAEIASTCPGAQPQVVDVWDKGDTIPKDGTERVDIARLDMGGDNPLRGKSVAVTGQFRINQGEVKRAVEAMGGSVKDVTGKTDAVIIGTRNVSFSKLCSLEKHQGKRNIAVIVGNDDLEALLYGDGRKFFG